MRRSQVWTERQGWLAARRAGSQLGRSLKPGKNEASPFGTRRLGGLLGFMGKQYLRWKGTIPHLGPGWMHNKAAYFTTSGYDPLTDPRWRGKLGFVIFQDANGNHKGEHRSRAEIMSPKGFSSLP